MSKSIEFLKMLKKKREENSGQTDFVTKVLKLGSNKFRIVGEYKFVFQHWIVTPDGVPVKVICHKKYDGVGNIVGSCPVCDKYMEARNLLNNEEGVEEEKYSQEEIEEAEIIVGTRAHAKSKYPSSWNSRVFVVFNVIDRDDNWCFDNNHTKIIAKTKSQPGLTAGKNGIWEDMLEEIVEIYGAHDGREEGHYENYDIRIKKSGSQMNTKYRTQSETQTSRPLTDEEKELEHYDLKEIFKPTPIETIKKWLNVGVGKNEDKKKEEDETTTTVRKGSKFKQANEEAKTKKTFKIKAKKEPEPEVEEPEAEESKVEEEYDESTHGECMCGTIVRLDAEKCPNPECGAIFEK